MPSMATSRMADETADAGQVSDPRGVMAWFDSARTDIPQIKTPILFRIASVCSALVMLGLVLAYVVVVAGLIWFVVDYLISHLRLFAGGATWGSVLAYVIPGVLVLLATLLMIKPLFHFGESDAEPVALTRRDQPKLFEYIERLCDLLGTPKPHGIKVDLSANAGALMRGAGSSRKLDLTLGLTLIAALDLRQFTGILAHELGHFTQRKGSSVQYLIHRVNSWFVRVIYERDAFDYWLFRLSQPGYGPIRLIVLMPRGLIALGRGVLWLFMILSHAASCLISRRAEFEADRFMTAIAGSKSVGPALQKTSVLSMAMDDALTDLTESWRQGRLVDNIPKLAVHRAQSIPPQRYDLLVRLIRADRTGWLHTHPSMVDRVSAARRINAAGMIDDHRPASELLDSFDALCERLTTSHYKHVLGKEFKESNLIPTQVLADELEAGEKAYEALRRYYQGEALLTRLIFPLPSVNLPPGSPQKSLEALKEVREQVIAQGPSFQKAIGEYANADGHLGALGVAQTIVGCGFTVDPAEYGLYDASPNSIKMGKRQLKQDMDKIDQELRPMEELIEDRLTLGLRLLRVEKVRRHLKEQDGDALIKRIDELLAACAPFASVNDNIRILSRRSMALAVLIETVGPETRHGKARPRIKSLCEAIVVQQQAIRDALDPVDYPFEHISGDVTIGGFLVEKLPAVSDPVEVTLSALETMDRIDSVLARVLAQLAHIAEKIETALGFAIEEEPDSTKDLKALAEQLEKTASKRTAVGIVGAGGAIAQTAVAACVALMIGGVMAGVKSAGPSVIDYTVPTHRQYQPTIMPQTWVTPTAPSSPIWPNQYNPSDPFGRNQPSQPYYPGQANYPNNPNNTNGPYGPNDPRNPNWPNANNPNPNRRNNQPNRQPTRPGYRQPTRPNQPGYPNNPNQRRPGQRRSPSPGYNPRPGQRSQPSRPGSSRPGSPSPSPYR